MLAPGTTLQLVPFQCSMSTVKGPNCGPVPPTAQTSSSATAATARSELKDVPGFGLGTMVQSCPSQRRISVLSSSTSPLVACPTAQACVGDSAATPSSSLSRLPVFGLGTMAQVPPFHDSTSVRCSVPKTVWPTCHTSPGELPLTALRMLSARPALGVLTMLQAAPFQCSASEWLLVPTLHTSPPLIAETASSEKASPLGPA